MKKFITTIYTFLIVSNLFGQVRTDYVPGMEYPQKIDLSELASSSDRINKIKVHWGKKSRRYKLTVNGYADIFLYPLEMDSLMSYAWGDYPVEFKKKVISDGIRKRGLDFTVPSDNRWINSRWTNDAFYCRRLQEHELALKYDDIVHPLFGIQEDDRLLTFTNIDITCLTIKSRKIKYLGFVNKPYYSSGLAKDKKPYIPTTFFMVRFEDMEDTDSYVIKLSPEESLFAAKILLGEYSVYDKKTILESLLREFRIEQAREKKNGWNFYTTKKVERKGFNIMDFINIFVPGAFKNEEIARFEALPENQRKFITNMALGISLNGAPTMMESFNSAQQAVISDYDNAK